MCLSPTLDAALPFENCFFFLLFVVVASRFAVVAVLPFPAVAGVVSLLSAMTASRSRSHGCAATSYLGVAVARKVIQVNMAHRALHLINVESRVSVHHHLDVLVLHCESLNTYVLQSAVGNCLAHLLELRARERLFHKLRVWVFSMLYVGVGELVHFVPGSLRQ